MLDAGPGRKQALGAPAGLFAVPLRLWPDAGLVEVIRQIAQLCFQPFRLVAG